MWRGGDNKPEMVFLERQAGNRSKPFRPTLEFQKGQAGAKGFLLARRRATKYPNYITEPS